MLVPVLCFQAGGRAGWSAPLESVELVTPGADWRGGPQTQKKSKKKSIFPLLLPSFFFPTKRKNKKRFLDGHLPHVQIDSCVDGER